ncbi:phage integrase family protein [Roseivivax marinus]|uniref:Phage integrase family protein n=1 Tax=Roseivivax marinus TaxID=1379903 RepID=W4HF92_9RHOB|nr:phage integrase family protein [Roseivivax marinus]
MHVSTRQYVRLVPDWVISIGLEPSAYGTHSMRRTKVAQIYMKTGNLRAVQLLHGHTKRTAPCVTSASNWRMRSQSQSR